MTVVVDVVAIFRQIHDYYLYLCLQLTFLVFLLVILVFCSFFSKNNFPSKQNRNKGLKKIPLILPTLHQDRFSKDCHTNRCAKRPELLSSVLNRCSFPGQKVRGREWHVLWCQKRKRWQRSDTDYLFLSAASWSCLLSGEGRGVEGSFSSCDREKGFFFVFYFF